MRDYTGETPIRYHYTAENMDKLVESFQKTETVQDNPWMETLELAAKCCHVAAATVFPPDMFKLSGLDDCVVVENALDSLCDEIMYSEKDDAIETETRTIEMTYNQMQIAQMGVGIVKSLIMEYNAQELYDKVMKAKAEHEKRKNDGAD